MKIKDSLYPYPILAPFNDDYINSEFNVEFDIKKDYFGRFKLTIGFHLIDDYLQQLISEDKVEYIVHIECSDTSYRKILLPNSKEDSVIEFIIDPAMFRNMVDLTAFIVAKQDIKQFNNPNFNKIYENINFKLQKGDTVAIFPTKVMNIERNIEDFSRLSSVIKVAPKNVKVMEVNSDGDIIYITLPREHYKNYVTFSKMQFQDIILSCVVFPSLIEILNRMSILLQEDSEITTYKWYVSISSKLKDYNINVDEINKKYSAIELAQRILQDPLERAFSDINKQINNINDQDREDY